MVTLPRAQPRTSMETSNTEYSSNGVNGGSSIEDAVAPGRIIYDRQVESDRHHASAGGSPGHAEQVPGRRRATAAMARTDSTKRIATWNVNTLFQVGKFENLKREAERMNLDAIGVSEVRWTGVGHIASDGWTFYYSGGERHEAGVGILLGREMARAVVGCWQVSKRVILVKIAAKPVGLNLIQVYAPTTDYSDREVDEFYEQVDSVRRQCKAEELTIVMGDLNAKVGKGRSGTVVGEFGLGERNERGDRWMEWCESWDQVIMNTWFKHHARHLYTWKSPGDRARNQIDYVSVNRRFRNSVTQVKTKPGADCGGGCDHVPVVAQIKVKVKKVKKNVKKKKDWNILRRIDGVKERYTVEVRNRYEKLTDELEGEGVEKAWQVLKEALVGAAETIIPKEKKKAKKAWITDEILAMMEERRKAKNQSEELYRELDRRVKRLCREKKEEWLNLKCKEIEDSEKVDSRAMGNHIRELSGKKRMARSTVIKDSNGDILTDREDVLERWRGYVEELYRDQRGDVPQFEGIEPGLPILKEEVEKAVKSMKWRKAEGSDGVVVEMVEASGEFGLRKITELANLIYSSGQVPESMKESEFLVIPKKNGAVECSNHRTISIMSQIAKIILKVLDERLKRKVVETVDKVQFGFRKGMGCRNATFMLRTVIERAVEKQRDIFMCFIDFEKAFDTVRHDLMVERLRELGVEEADLRVLSNLYWGQKATVRIGDDKSGWTEIQRGVRQGCVLSPDLFSLYSQAVMDELEELEGIRIGGTNINNIRYADDTVLVADTENKLQRLVDRLDEGCNRYGLKINKRKTEVMGITKRREQLPVQIGLGGDILNQVNSFKYLGSLITEDAKCETDIRARIGMAKAAFGQLRKILVSMSINIRTRVRLLKTYVWSVLLFGCEAWTVSREMQKRLEAAEMFFYRRMLRIPWTARRTNEEVLQMAGVEREMMNFIRKRQLGFLGHILRGSGMERNCLLGMIEGRRARGRQRQKYMDKMKELLRCERIDEVLRLAENRVAWRSIAANINIDTALR